MSIHVCTFPQSPDLSAFSLWQKWKRRLCSTFSVSRIYWVCFYYNSVEKYFDECTMEMISHITISQTYALWKWYPMSQYLIHKTNIAIHLLLDYSNVFTKLFGWHLGPLPYFDLSVSLWYTSFATLLVFMLAWLKFCLDSGCGCF